MRESSPSDWKFLAITAFLVAVFAIPTLASLFAPDQEDLNSSKLFNSVEPKEREPASLPELGQPKTSLAENSKKELSQLSDHSSISYDFSCAKHKTKDFKVEGGYLQLKGKDCNKNSQFLKLSVTNKSNGFTAAVFMLDGKEYQTDLIQLNNGENQISIQYQLPSGQVEEHVLNVKADAI